MLFVDDFVTLLVSFLILFDAVFVRFYVALSKRRFSSGTMFSNSFACFLHILFSLSDHFCDIKCVKISCVFCGCFTHFWHHFWFILVSQNQPKCDKHRSFFSLFFKCVFVDACWCHFGAKMLQNRLPQFIPFRSFWGFGATGASQRPPGFHFGALFCPSASFGVPFWWHLGPFCDHVWSFLWPLCRFGDIWDPSVTISCLFCHL